MSARHYARRAAAKRPVVIDVIKTHSAACKLLSPSGEPCVCNQRRYRTRRPRAHNTLTFHLEEK